MKLKLRYPIGVSLLLGGLVLLASGFVAFFKGVETPTTVITVAILTGVVILVGAIAASVPWGYVEPGRIEIKGRHRESVYLRTLGPGERFVIVGRRVYVDRADGSLEKTWVARWLCSRRVWRALRAMFPTVEAGPDALASAAPALPRGRY